MNILYVVKDMISRLVYCSTDSKRVARSLTAEERECLSRQVSVFFKNKLSIEFEYPLL